MPGGEGLGMAKFIINIFSKKIPDPLQFSYKNNTMITTTGNA